MPQEINDEPQRLGRAYRLHARAAAAQVSRADHVRGVAAFGRSSGVVQQGRLGKAGSGHVDGSLQGLTRQELEQRVKRIHRQLFFPAGCARYWRGTAKKNGSGGGKEKQKKGSMEIKNKMVRGEEKKTKKKRKGAGRR